MQAEELIDDLLSLESSSLASDSFKTSDSSLANDINIKNEPYLLSEAELHALAKDRQKKDNHNMSKSKLNFYLKQEIVHILIILICTQLLINNIVLDHSLLYKDSKIIRPHGKY